MKDLVLTQATEGDCGRLWLWRNHPLVRKNFFDENPVPWEAHKRWFYSKIKDEGTKIYIANMGKERVGVIRFQTDKDSISVSVNLNPSFFGRGLGTEIIRLGTERFLSETKTAKSIIAEIKEDNTTSAKAFSKAGYKYEEKRKERLVYKKG